MNNKNKKGLDLSTMLSKARETKSKLVLPDRLKAMDKYAKKGKLPSLKRQIRPLLKHTEKLYEEIKMIQYIIQSMEADSNKLF